MYEDITNETFQADGEFWESISLPWDDYDDYLPKEDLNNISITDDYEINQDRDVSFEQWARNPH